MSAESVQDRDKENAGVGKSRAQLLQEWRASKGGQSTPKGVVQPAQKTPTVARPSPARSAMMGLQGSAGRVISETGKLRKKLAREIKSWGPCMDVNHMRRQFDKLLLINADYQKLADYWCYRSRFEQLYGESAEAVRILEEGMNRCVGSREREQIRAARDQLTGNMHDAKSPDSGGASSSAHFQECATGQPSAMRYARHPNTVAAHSKTKSIFGACRQAEPTTPKASAQERRVGFATPRSLNLKGPAMRREVAQATKSPGASREVRKLQFDESSSVDSKKTVLTPVRANAKLKKLLGSESVVTPVRRSGRKQATGGADKAEGEISVRDMLEQTEFSYAPNASLHLEEKQPRVVQQLFPDEEEEDQEKHMSCTTTTAAVAEVQGLEDEGTAEEPSPPPEDKNPAPTETSKTPRRRKVAITDTDIVESSRQVLVPVRLNKKAANAVGSDVALTPVRRSTRSNRWRHSDEKEEKDIQGDGVAGDSSQA